MGSCSGAGGKHFLAASLSPRYRLFSQDKVTTGRRQVRGPHILPIYCCHYMCGDGEHPATLFKQEESFNQLRKKAVYAPSRDNLISIFS